jgi:TolB protein
MSPDGTNIAFMSNRDGSLEIYTMAADGSNQTRLTFEGANWDPIWSPDGTRILFNSDRDGKNDIFVMNSDGSSMINITDNGAGNTQPEWLGR